jgi:DNA-binding NtrC family response regulator
MTQLLSGKRVLIVEDDNILAMALADELAAEGATVIGPAASVTDALEVIASSELDSAIVDINLGGKAAFPVADALADRRVPFVFATGYLIADYIPARHANVRRFEKPTAPGAIRRALEEALSRAKP